MIPRKLDFIRISIGVIFILFGALKFFPNFSPAEELAGRTIEMITFGMITGKLALVLLGILEVGIGISLAFKIYLRWTIPITLGHMICTFLPLFLLPEYSYTQAPTSLSLVAQYILKNLIIVTALLAIYCDHVNCMAKYELDNMDIKK